MEEEQEKQTENGSESSTEQESNKQLSVEELLEQNKKLEEQNSKLVQHLRKQSDKRKLSGDDDKQEENKKTIPVEEIEELRQEIRQIKEAQSTVSSEAKDSSLKWLYSQPFGKDFAPENDLSGDNFVRLNREMTKLLQGRIIHTAEDYQKVLRLAVVNATGKPDALIVSKENEDQEKSQATLRQMAGGPGGSIPVNKPNKNIGKTDAEKKALAEHEERMRQRFPNWKPKQ